MIFKGSTHRKTPAEVFLEEAKAAVAKTTAQLDAMEKEGGLAPGK